MLEQCDHCGGFKSVLLPVIRKGELLDICHDCYVEMTDKGIALEFQNDEDEDLAEHCEHEWRETFGGECEQCIRCGVYDC